MMDFLELQNMKYVNHVFKFGLVYSVTCRNYSKLCRRTIVTVGSTAYKINQNNVGFWHL